MVPRLEAEVVTAVAAAVEEETVQVAPHQEAPHQEANPAAAPQEEMETAVVAVEVVVEVGAEAVAVIALQSTKAKGLRSR